MAKTIAPPPEEAQRQIDEDVDHEVTLHQITAALVLSLLGFVSSQTSELYSLVSTSLADFDRGDDVLLTRDEQRRLQRVGKAVDKWTRGVVYEVRDRLKRELGDLIEFEVEYQTQLWAGRLGQDVKAPTASQIREIIDGDIYLGRTLNEHINKLLAANASRIVEQINQGVLEGEPVEQIIERLRGTRLLRFNDGEMDKFRRNVRAVIQTARTHASNAVIATIASRNQTAFDRVQWISVLDGKTSAICRARAGMVYSTESNYPRPPAHFNCRSILRPLRIGEKPVTGLKYDTWLKRQPASRQDEILGPARGKLFREGKSVRQFVSRDGAALNLDQIRKREADR